MGAGRMRFMRGPSFTYASDTTSRSTSTCSNRSCTLAIADCSTFSTVGAMRLFVVRSVLSAAPAFWPRIRSTTSRAFCGEIRIYRASALASMVFLLCRLSHFLRSRLHRVALEGPRRRKFAQLMPHHVFGDVHRDELLAVVDRNGVPHKLGKNGGAPRPRPHHLFLIGGAEHC